MEAPLPFTIDVVEQGHTTVVTIVGELDLATAPELQTVCADITQRGVQRICLDMRGVSFLDSSGINVLVHAHKDCATQGAALILEGLGTSARRVLEVVGLDDYFELAD